MFLALIAVLQRTLGGLRIAMISAKSRRAALSKWLRFFIPQHLTIDMGARQPRSLSIILGTLHQKWAFFHIDKDVWVSTLLIHLVKNPV